MTEKNVYNGYNTRIGARWVFYARSIFRAVRHAECDSVVGYRRKNVKQLRHSAAVRPFKEYL